MAVTPAGPPLRLGALGARSFVLNAAIVPAIERSPAVELVAVSSRGGHPPEELAAVSRPTYEEVLAADIDAVYLPLPNGDHPHWVERCLDGGLHVLCEKPLTVDSARARALAERAERAGLVLAEAWMTPFDPRYARALELAGELGELRHIRTEFTFTIGADRADNYRWSPHQGGGALWDVGVYTLGPVVELWDAHPERVLASRVSRQGVDASTSAQLSWSDGRSASIMCSFEMVERQLLELSGTEGRLRLEADAFTGGPSATDIEIITAAGRRIERVDPADCYQLMLERFAAAVAAQAPWPRPATTSAEMIALMERIAHHR